LYERHLTSAFQSIGPALWCILRRCDVLRDIDVTFIDGYFILVLKPLAEYVGLVDEPSFRKHHAGVVPLVGGVAIYAALVLATAAFPALQTRSGLGLIALCLPIMAAGVADDRWEVSFKLRMALEILCCVAAASGLTSAC
jgi:UDP-GlcNAc:undecaprenyl-phosphate GlcNAc-1-phosphate transferase